MRTERQRGLVIAAGIGLWVALAAACMGKPDYPPFVESGNLTGDEATSTGGALTPPSEAGTGDGGIDDEGGLGGTPLGSMQACPLSNGTCEETIGGVSPTTPPTCSAVVAATCPSAGVVGCCAVTDSFGNNLQTCYYTGTTATQSTSAGCLQATGTFSSTPNF